ncbi:Ku protein [Carbonactinospora thermoautotrophica]|uniref:Non-homologous end joining protein Ku n=2 Tax=Carbonactinospora thermoautotrophica TaxID=1469144 RepID=A0A132NHL7_9ACTN|nr:Ku protein [Carbonactinospora thermoautotrophica]KWW99337.1 putative DNA repair protein [Carbonactinospora thermoautotrophica]KWX04195.1 DNA repair protein [Carbonactinospora thermoautotrophica]KWX09506.1 DNA repair protein [Carbonactinospora thermoautotrophica]MCX9192534.1 Ku protein [Carbonactinospora thermoautotrophica]
MQTIWKGAISFGFVTIPIRLYAATEERDVAFHQVHAKDKGRIRHRRVCELEGKEVPYTEIARGYELPDGDVVVLTDEDLEDLPLVSSKVIDVLKFVPLDQVDCIYLQRSYYLQPDETGAKPYVLLRDALERSGKVALVKVTLRNRESLALLRARDGVLVLHTMLWPDEIRDPKTVAPPEDVSVQPQEIAVAESYITMLTEDFQPDEYVDEYRQAVAELVQAKAAGRETRAPEKVEVEVSKVVDLMAALQASVEAAKKQRVAAETGRTSARRTAAEKSQKAGESTTPAPKTAKKTARKTPRKPT